MPLEQDIEADRDLATILGQFTNYIQNERVRAYNDGVDAERERCAKIAKEVLNRNGYEETADLVAAAILKKE